MAGRLFLTMDSEFAVVISSPTSRIHEKNIGTLPVLLFLLLGTTSFLWKNIPLKNLLKSLYCYLFVLHDEGNPLRIVWRFLAWLLGQTNFSSLSRNMGSVPMFFKQRGQQGLNEKQKGLIPRLLDAFVTRFLLFLLAVVFVVRSQHKRSFCIAKI